MIPKHGDKINNQPPKPEAQISSFSATTNNDNQSRSKGANSADLSLPSKPGGRRRSMRDAPPRRITREERLANLEFDTATKAALLI